MSHGVVLDQLRLEPWYLLEMEKDEAKNPQDEVDEAHDAPQVGAA